MIGDRAELAAVIVSWRLVQEYWAVVAGSHSAETGQEGVTSAADEIDPVWCPAALRELTRTFRAWMVEAEDPPVRADEWHQGAAWLISSVTPTDQRVGAAEFVGELLRELTRATTAAGRPDILIEVPNPSAAVHGAAAMAAWIGQHLPDPDQRRLALAERALDYAKACWS